MLVIPEDVSRRLHETLLDCDPFNSHEELVDVFLTSECLRLWKDSVPERPQKNARVRALIGFLQSKSCPLTQENALIVFLRILRDDTKSTTRAELADLINRLISTPASNSEYTPRPFLVQQEVTGNPGHNSRVSTDYDDKLRAIKRAVGKLIVPQYRSSQLQLGHSAEGTAWLITPELALTCYHVIENKKENEREEVDYANLRKQAINSRLIFDYIRSAEGEPYGIAELVDYDRELDYALLRLKGTPAQVPRSERGVVPLKWKVTITPGMELVVIHYPRGDPQETTDGECIRVDEACIYYDMETAKGSSGAPLLDKAILKAIALHTSKDDEDRPRAACINEILSHIERIKPELFEEIKRTHPGGGL